MYRSFTMLSLVLGLASPLLAQNPIGLPPGGPGDYTLTINDATAAVGGTLDVPVLINTNQPTVMVMFEEMNDPGALTVTGFTLGAGLQANSDAFGMPPSCDSFIHPDGSGIGLFMFLAGPYDTAQFGDEFVILHFEVAATVAGTTEIQLLDTMMGNMTTATVTIVDETPIVRGDINGDMTCNIADAVGLLGHLFQGNPLGCMDAADVNDSGTVDISDAIGLLNSVFGASDPLNEACSLDTTTDSLADCVSSGC